MLPATPTFPVLRTLNAKIAVLSKFRNSWARNPRRSFPRAVSPSSVELILFASEFGDGARDGVVKASVQRAKSSVLMGALISTARSVMA